MGKIKTASLSKYDYVLKDINAEEFELKGGIYNKTTYDDEGRTLVEIKYDETGGVEQHYEYAYDEKGARTADRSYDETGELIDDLEYKVDEDGKNLFGYKKYLDGSKDTITYRYDDEGNLIERELKSDEDEIEFIDKHTYLGGNEILHESFDEDNELVYRKESTYDAKANVSEEKTWMLETDRTALMKNTYDDEGQLTSVASYSENDDLIFRVDYERNDKGHISQVTEESPEGVILTTIGYDDSGNAVMQIEKNEDGEINSRIERKYDAEGNITESEAILDRHGKGMNQHYILKYEYEMY
jgi:hypothetical protein